MISIEKIIHVEEPIMYQDFLEVLKNNESNDSLDNKYFVINKPPSIPVHSGGNYSKNSLMKFIHDEYGKDVICKNSVLLNLNFKRYSSFGSCYY